MRISTTQQQAGLMQGLQSAGQKHVNDWNKVASGKKFVRAAENPPGSAQLAMIRREFSLTGGYLGNAQTLKTQLNLEESLLQTYQLYLQRARELVLQANSGVMDQQGLAAQGQEVEQMTMGIIDLLNTRDSEGQYLFAGVRSDTPPVTLTPEGEYLFNMNDEVRQVTVASHAQVAAWDTACDLCFRIDDGQNHFNLLEVLHEIVTALKSPPEQINNLFGHWLIRLDQAITKAGSLSTDLGSRLNILEAIKEGHEKSIMVYQQQIAGLSDLDYAETLTSLNRQAIMLEATRKGLQRVNDLSLFKYL